MTSQTTARRTAARTPRSAGEEGAAVLEMAFAFVVFFALLWGIISYGVIFSVDHTLAAAAAEGARAAVGTRTEGDAVAAAEAAARDQLTALGGHALHASVATPTVADCVAPVGARCITVTVTYPWAAQPVVPALIPGATPATLSSVSTVQLSS